jgi:hypothetical protein
MTTGSFIADCFLFCAKHFPLDGAADSPSTPESNADEGLMATRVMTKAS